MQFCSTMAKSLALSLCIAPALVAQDECVNAAAVTLGVNGPFTNVGATTSPEVWTCPTTGGSDLWYVYTAANAGILTAATCGADFDTGIEAFDGSAGCGALTFIDCNDDFCGLDSQISFPVTAGGTYYIRVGGFSAATGNFPLELSLDLGFALEAVAEAVPGSGTLSQGGGTFQNGNTLRWNYSDAFGNFPNGFAAVVMNFGIAGSAPVGVTAAIPGFNQLWGGSTPVGAFEVFGPAQIGAPDFSVLVPNGLFAVGDTVRVQALVLSTLASGSLPVVPSGNTIELEASLCASGASFENLSGLGNYPGGWSNGGGGSEWQGNSGTTSSSGTGPTTATAGVSYFYCETSSPVAGRTFIANTAPVSSASLVANTLSFDLSRVGATIGTLEVRMDDGTGAFATVLATYTGPEPAGLEWTNEVINLPAGLPATVQFQFNYAQGSSFTGDIAIDNYCVQ